MPDDGDGAGAVAEPKDRVQRRDEAAGGAEAEGSSPCSGRAPAHGWHYEKPPARPQRGYRHDLLAWPASGP